MRDRDGNTALHLAAKWATSAKSADKLECLETLLRAKEVDVCLHNLQGETALKVAAGCPKAEQLIKKHAKSEHPRYLKHYSDNVRRQFEKLMNNKFSELVDELQRGDAWHLAFTNYCGYTLLQYAAEKGLHEFVEELVKQVNFSESSDTNGRTPLMLACVQNDCKMVRLLLEADGIGSSNVNAKDSKDNTALHFAAENGDLEMVLILLRHGADISARNKTEKYPFSADQLEAILDKNLYTKGNRLPSHRNYVIVFNYRLLVRHRQCSPPTENLTSILGRCRNNVKAQLGAHTAQSLQNEYSEMYFLNCLINSEQHTSLLHHPVISSFLKLKYERAKWLLYLNLLLCLVFAIFINTFIGVHVSNSDSGNQTQAEFSLRAVVIALAVVMSIRVVLQYLLSPLPCYKNFENAVALAVIVCTALVLSGSFGHSHAACTAAVLSSWLHLFLLTGRHHMFSKNFEMFKTVSTNYLRLLASYVFVIFAFAFSFYILFSPTPVSNQNTSVPIPENISKVVVNESFQKNSSEGAENDLFESPTRAIFKTVIMMTGEFDAGDLPFGSNFWTGAVVFLLFLFLLPVVLLNLLTALAISDEQRITSSAETLKLVTQVKFLWETEGMVMNAHNFFKQWGYSRFSERLETLWVFHKVPPNDAYIEVWPNRVEGTRISGNQNYTSHKFKPHIVQNAINIVKKRTVSSAERSSEQYNLSELLKRLESMEEKFQKLNVDLEASLAAATREQQPEEFLFGLPIL